MANKVALRLNTRITYLKINVQSSVVHPETTKVETLNVQIAPLSETAASKTDSTSKLGHAMIQPDRSQISARLQQYEELGLIKGGERTRMLSSNMTDKEINEFLDKIVDYILRRYVRPERNTFMISY